MNKQNLNVGDRVKLVGHSSWNQEIRRDIGKIGIVSRVASWYCEIKLLSTCSGCSAWNIVYYNGIVKYEPGKQLLLPGMEMLDV